MSSPEYFALAAHRAFAMSASEEKADMTIRSKILSAFVIVCGLFDRIDPPACPAAHHRICASASVAL
jgi:hypothetical protein